MTAREKTKGQAGRRELRIPRVMRLSECMIRFLLAAALAGADLLEGQAFFAVALVGATGGGLDGLAALLGAAVGYLTFRGFLEGLRYIAAAMMTFAVALAAWDSAAARRSWFMPVATALLNGLVGFVYLSPGGWDGRGLALFFSELVLTAGAVYAYRLAFSVWQQRREGGLSLPQLVGTGVLAVTLLMALDGVAVGGVLSLGRVLAAVAVLAAGWKGGVGAGAAAGVAAGLAMELSAAPTGCAMVFAFVGLMAGVFSRQGRGFVAVGSVLSAGAAVLWAGGEELTLLWEVSAGAVVLLILPPKLFRRLAALTRQEGAREGERRGRDYIARHLSRAASAFETVSAGLEGLFARQEGDEDAVRLFDRAAERVCRGCAQAGRCWQSDYQSTRSALNDALPAILDRGQVRGEDFPSWFADRCPRLRRFLEESDRELERLLTRRMYESRLRESRMAVCAQYRQLAGVLEGAAVEAAAELSVDVRRQRQLKQRMAALGLEGRCAVFADEHGRLRLEVEGRGVETLAHGEALDEVQQLMGCPLRVEREERDVLYLAQREVLSAVAGVAAMGKDGVPVSGDTGAWFKDGKGALCVLLCDGMGSGLAARRDSDGAVRMLEKFLKAGIAPLAALEAVGQALALKGEAEGGFTTVDLLHLDLFSGGGAVYKLGAAPTWVGRPGGSWQRLAGTSLPAGIPGGEAEQFPLALQAGDWVVMVSDGITGGGPDGWLGQTAAGFEGSSPRELAEEILARSKALGLGGDDRTVIVLRLDSRKGA